jgi:hypothetical protein
MHPDTGLTLSAALGSLPFGYDTAVNAKFVEPRGLTRAAVVARVPA